VLYIFYVEVLAGRCWIRRCASRRCLVPSTHCGPRCTNPITGRTISVAMAVAVGVAIGVANAGNGAGNGAAAVAVVIAVPAPEHFTCHAVDSSPWASGSVQASSSTLQSLGLGECSSILVYPARHHAGRPGRAREARAGAGMILPTPNASHSSHRL